MVEFLLVLILIGVFIGFLVWSAIKLLERAIAASERRAENYERRREQKINEHLANNNDLIRQKLDQMKAQGILTDREYSEFLD